MLKYCLEKQKLLVLNYYLDLIRLGLMPMQYYPNCIPLNRDVYLDTPDRCDYPCQLDSREHLCGGRAASVRPGGRLAKVSLGATLQGFPNCFFSDCTRLI